MRGTTRTGAQTVAECLNCGETPESLKRQGITMCAIEGGYEYREIEHEFAHHRWADWRDRELDMMGIKPEAYDKHRRTPALHMQWVGCEDTKRGHVPATKESDREDFGCRTGQCIACGQVPGSSVQEPEHQNRSNEGENR